MSLPDSFAAADAVNVMNQCGEELVGSYAPILVAMVGVGEQAVRDNFTSSATPSDSNWLPRKIDGDGHPLLIDKGNLLQAATGGGAGHIARVFENTAEIGVDLTIVAYARAHNYGNPARRLPQREFLGMREERQAEAEELLGEWTLQNKF